MNILVGKYVWERSIEISFSLINSSMLHIVSQWDTDAEQHLLQGGVPPHYLLPVCAFCDRHFPGKGIGH
jgi:hypothetical protein